MHRKPFTLLSPLAMFLLSTVGAPTLAVALTCTAGSPNPSVIETTPTSDFTVNGDGTVAHAKTGLMWKRCAEGLSGEDCITGTVAHVSWPNALAASNAANAANGGLGFANHTDWRLPNQKELQSIVESCGIGSAINQVVFPAVPGFARFWSSTSYVNAPYSAWDVYFYNGASEAYVKGQPAFLRLVRGGQPLDSFDAQSATLDVDASLTATKYDALTDGLLILRYLFGLTGTSLTNGAVGATATRTDPAAIKAYLDGIRTSLDIDGNGTADALTDGLLIIRYLFGLRGSSLITGAVDSLGTRKTATEIETYISGLVP